MTGVGLTEISGVLGEQANQEVDPAEVTITQLGEPGPDFGLDLDLIQPGHASDAICICCYDQQLGQAPKAMWAARMQLRCCQPQLISERHKTIGGVWDHFSEVHHDLTLRPPPSPKLGNQYQARMCGWSGEERGHATGSSGQQLMVKPLPRQLRIARGRQDTADIHLRGWLGGGN